MTEQRRTGTAHVVVGVDGSPGGHAAAAFAVGEAQLRGARLVAVIALTAADAAHFDPYSTRRHPKADIVARAEDTVRATLADLDCADLDIRIVVSADAPARALIEHSATADLLVVGSRGHSGLAGLVLGSTSLRCLGHARCPVTVIRPEPATLPGRVRSARA